MPIAAFSYKDIGSFRRVWEALSVLVPQAYRIGVYPILAMRIVSIAITVHCIQCTALSKSSFEVTISQHLCPTEP